MHAIHLANHTQFLFLVAESKAAMKTKKCSFVPALCPLRHIRMVLFSLNMR